MGVRNHTAMKAGAGIPGVVTNHVAWTEPNPQDRGQAARGSRISRVGSTARKTGSGVAGGGR